MPKSQKPRTFRQGRSAAAPAGLPEEDDVVAEEDPEPQAQEADAARPASRAATLLSRPRTSPSRRWWP
eukprot:9880673-Lingulodinium_polyedra.AAC.1